MTLRTTLNKPVHTTKTVYLGPEASFSHQAAIEALPETTAVSLPSFRAILSAIQQSKNPKDESGYAYGVLPVENSTNGSVVQSLDLLAQCRLDPDTSAFPDIEVIDEHYLEVHHCLFVAREWAEQRLTREDLDQLESDPKSTPDQTKLKALLGKLNIRTLYTHPQVWGQCNLILSSLLPPGHVERVDLSSTSAAAAFVATHPSSLPLPNEDADSVSGNAAISSALAGAKHKTQLICLARNIEDEPGANTTRFLILRNRNRGQTHAHTLEPNNNNDNGNAHPISSCSVESQERNTSKVQVKSLWTFTTPHRTPGSLAKALSVFATHGLNLSAIQSRPKPRPKKKNSNKTDDDENTTAEGNGSAVVKGGRFPPNWQYVFFVECLHHRSREPAEMQEDQELQALFEDLKLVTDQLSLLGSWVDRQAETSGMD